MNNIEKTTEDKLKAIIEAQVKGGYTKYKEKCMIHGEIFECINDDGYVANYDYYEFQDASVLNILLDTNGCKAAYGEEKINKVTCEGLPFDIDSLPKWWVLSLDILDAWHSKEGNNYIAAIDTAYDLLPL